MFSIVEKSPFLGTFGNFSSKNLILRIKYKETTRLKNFGSFPVPPFKFNFEKLN